MLRTTHPRRSEGASRGEVAASGRRGEPVPFEPRQLRLIPPGLIVLVLLGLITAQLCYAFLPYRRRAFVPILVLTAVGYGLGQLWDFLGLPALRLGQAAVVPGLAFALLLQPLARFVPRPGRAPREPESGNSKPRT